jgi:demethylmenaquinone methyltransferase/2-methoxy-6-polyprenyl-1,4-benzoquinol methylase
MKRVIKPGGKAVILEFSLPSNKFFRSVYFLYFKRILPIVGALVSKKNGAYSYLPASVMSFPKREEFAGIMKSAGLKDIAFYDITFGIVSVYVGTK